MKLTEVLACIVIFLISSAAFMGSLAAVSKGTARAESASRAASAALKTDRLLREEIRSIEIPYWNNFSHKYEAAAERILDFAEKHSIAVSSVSPVYDKVHRAEGIKVEWSLGGSNYVTQEYIKQRIADEE